MSWISELCKAYEHLEGAETERTNPLVPAGFILKSVALNIILKPDGTFATAQRIPDEQQLAAVPTTQQAEGRTGTQAFPLADNLIYFISGADGESPYYKSYIEQLEAWCEMPEAPEVLRIVLGYLQKKTLYEDLMSVPGLELKYDKNAAMDGQGKEAKLIACFSVQSTERENRLWLDPEVRKSWQNVRSAFDDGEVELCYATGKWLPAMTNHPKMEGFAKIISGKDAGFPFQYKGRFAADRSSSTVSSDASVKAHNALKWLLTNQGMKRFGMSIVGWNTAKPELEDSDFADPLFDDENPEKKRYPDTFEVYAKALRNASLGNGKWLESFNNTDKLPQQTIDRANNIVIMALQAVTPGRMSIAYYQEMPGNQYVKTLEKWYSECQWEIPGKNRTVRTPTWREICETVIGRDQVQTAMRDTLNEKSASKLMCDMQMRLLNCTVNASPIPKSFVDGAFERAVRPQAFTDSSGKWDRLQWEKSIAVACALIRKQSIDRSRADIRPELDCTCTDRSYLYGRLLAAAHKLERDAQNDHGRKTNAVRMMTQFTQAPAETWAKLYFKLSPYMRSLGSKDGHSAIDFQRLFGEIERMFTEADRKDVKPLSKLFLVGYSAQLRELYLPAERRSKKAVPTPFAPPESCSELFGCLFAIADDCEWRAEREDGLTFASRRDGRTNAMRLISSAEYSPARTWQTTHNKLIPYLEKSGVRRARYTQRLFRRVEQSFDASQRCSCGKLDGGFLHGYLSMRSALASDGLDKEKWLPLRKQGFEISDRDDAFGALMALEDRAERWALDRDKTDGDNRPSNAMRFMSAASKAPDKTVPYLSERMRPYIKKLGFPKQIVGEYGRITEIIRENGWLTGEPLGAGYLHAFYTYEMPDQAKRKGE